MNVLIVGGRGMIGQEIAKSHSAKGDTVYLYDVRVNPYIDYKAPYIGIEAVQGNYPSIEAFLKKVPIDLISYQGAVVGIGESQYKPTKYAQYNIQMLAEFQQFLMEEGIRAPVIHAGSMGPYGEGQYYCHTCDRPTVPRQRSFTSFNAICPICGGELPLNDKMHSFETDILHPVSTYGITKMTQEEMWRNYANITGVPVISLRYFSVYGMEQSPLNPRTGVLNMIANQIINSSAILFNEDGEQTRDMVNAETIGKLHYDVSRKPLISFTACNVCTGVGHSLNWMASRMLDAMYSTHEIIHTGEYRKGDIRHARGAGYALRTLDIEVKDTLAYDIERYGDWVSRRKDVFRGKTWQEERDRCKKAGIQ